MRFSSFLLFSFLWVKRLNVAVGDTSVLIQENENNIVTEKKLPNVSQSQPFRSLVGWRSQDFPNPTTSSSSCRIGRICDPDSILKSEEMEKLALIVQDFEKTETVSCSTSSGTTQIPVQLAIALVQRLDLSSFAFSGDDREMKAAESFCRSLHDSWGVGNNVPECGGGTGIVIFVSVVDRALFISRGGALDAVLTNARLDRLINEQIKPQFRQKQYSDGIKAAIQQIHVYLERGPPSWTESFRLKDCLVVLFLLANVFPFARAGWLHRRSRREYARVSSQLSQLDRAKAEVLQGKYRVTSCPICLEDFQEKPTKPPTSTKHDDVEATELLNSSNHSHAENAETHEHEAVESSPKNSPATTLVGSDGLPLKLLQCGHVFDETCWAEWVSKGSSVSRCPICKQDVGVRRDLIDRRTTPAPRDDNDDDDDQTSCRTNQQRDRALRQYQHERYFRLTRLGTRYPNFVQPSQIQRWSESTYDGSLVQDPTFVQSNPQVIQATTSNNRNSSDGGSSSFGGGFSSGGRGGRW